MTMTSEQAGEEFDKARERAVREQQLTHAVRELCLNLARVLSLPDEARVESVANSNFLWLRDNLSALGDEALAFEVFGYMWMMGWWQFHPLTLDLQSSEMRASWQETAERKGLTSEEFEYFTSRDPYASISGLVGAAHRGLRRWLANGKAYATLEQILCADDVEGLA